MKNSRKFREFIITLLIKVLFRQVGERKPYVKAVKVSEYLAQPIDALTVIHRHRPSGVLLQQQFYTSVGLYPDVSTFRVVGDYHLMPIKVHALYAQFMILPRSYHFVQVLQNSIALPSPLHFQHIASPLPSGCVGCHP